MGFIRLTNDLGELWIKAENVVQISKLESDAGTKVTYFSPDYNQHKIYSANEGPDEIVEDIYQNLLGD